MIEEWINSKYLKDIKKYKLQFKKNKPFPYLSLKNFLNENKAKNILKAIREEDYYIEDHDLYQFLRTVDFKEIKLKNKIIKDFYEFIFSNEFILFIENLTGEKNLKKTGDLHSLKLLDTHYLLCHNDEVQDRKLAFILNLSENIKKENMGSLDLFSVDENRLPKKIEKNIFPKFNQFNIFLVSDISYHQISEFQGEGERESISGWFYK